MHLPIICDAIARGGLAAVRLAILTVGDNDRGRLGGIDLLQAAEAAVAAVEARKCEHQRALLMAISQLVRQLCLGAKARAAGKEVGRLAGRVQFPVDARRRAQRARNPRPQRAGRAECPIHATAGLDLKSGVVVVLDLCAERDVKPIGRQSDLIWANALNHCRATWGGQKAKAAGLTKRSLVSR